MAKISTIKFDFNNIPQTVNVNCTSGGEFNAYLPEEISAALRIRPKLTANTLNELEKKFFDALKTFKEATTTEETYILIAYYARGYFTYNKDKIPMFGGYNHKYNLEVNSSRPTNAIGLDFMVAIKQTIDGKEKWFKAKLGNTFAHFQKQSEQPDIYHKDGDVHNLSDYKKIPFSQIALDSLKNASEKIRAASELLFNFIEQDEDQILLTLTNQKLLN